MSFVANPRDAILGFYFADSRFYQLPTLQAAQVIFTELDSTVSAFVGLVVTYFKSNLSFSP